MTFVYSVSPRNSFHPATMELTSAKDLQSEILAELHRRPDGGDVQDSHESQINRASRLHPVKPSIAVGICRRSAEYVIALWVQDPALLSSSLLDRIVERTRGEVDVRYIGTVRKLTHLSGANWRHERVRPLRIGTSVSHVEVPLGSIGAFVTSGGVPCLLSNNHVLANENRARTGDAIIQPAAADGGREPEDAIATLHRFVPLRWNEPNYVDAAIAAVTPGIDFDPSALGEIYGHSDARLSGIRSCEDGEFVFKTGRSTGVMRGRVKTCELNGLVVGYEQGNAIYNHQIVIEPSGHGAFADDGDSGSLVVDGDGAAIGLIFAADTASSELTYVNPIGRVLSELDVTLLY